MKNRTRKMSPKRKEKLWDRLYHMDGFGIADYLNEFFQIPGAHWRATQHGEYAFLAGAHGEIIRFDRLDLWRENVSYYFDGMCDATPCLRDETFCDVFVFKVCRIMLSRLLNNEAVLVNEPPHARRLLFC